MTPEILAQSPALTRESGSRLWQKPRFVVFKVAGWPIALTPQDNQSLRKTEESTG